MHIMMEEIFKEKQYKTVCLKSIGDERGSLVALEEYEDIPFQVKRVYYIYNTQLGVHRGKHAHYALQQLIVSVAGSCTFLLDTGSTKEHIELTSPTQGLYIQGGVWREMYNFSPDCVLLVLASERYDERDYIRNYSDFLTIYSEPKGV